MAAQARSALTKVQTARVSGSGIGCSPHDAAFPTQPARSSHPCPLCALPANSIATSRGLRGPWAFTWAKETDTVNDVPGPQKHRLDPKPHWLPILLPYSQNRWWPGHVADTIATASSKAALWRALLVELSAPCVRQWANQGVPLRGVVQQVCRKGPGQNHNPATGKTFGVVR